MAVARRRLLLVRSRFTPFRYLDHAIDLIRGKYDNPDHPGHINHFGALSAALAGTMGMGNIAGVALAIKIGGPGAIFWMWMTAILGIATGFYLPGGHVSQQRRCRRTKRTHVRYPRRPAQTFPFLAFFAIVGMVGCLPALQANDDPDFPRLVFIEQGLIAPGAVVYYNKQRHYFGRAYRYSDFGGLPDVSHAQPILYHLWQFMWQLSYLHCC